ncbi:MAG TPA: hypothetical protein PK250_16830 [Syntrophobacter fumaroxidans]|nr:hypothetical protein [Syntrophobacter fumaroxidans]
MSETKPFELPDRVSHYIGGDELLDCGMRAHELLDHVKAGRLTPRDKNGEPLESPVVAGLRKSLSHHEKKRISREPKDINLYIAASKHGLADLSGNQWGYLRFTGNERFDAATMAPLLKADYLVSEVRSLSNPASGKKTSALSKSQRRWEAAKLRAHALQEQRKKEGLPPLTAKEYATHQHILAAWEGGKAPKTTYLEKIIKTQWNLKLKKGRPPKEE